VLEEFQLSVEMLALKYNQAKLAAFARALWESCISFGSTTQEAQIQREQIGRTPWERKIDGIC